MRRKSRIWGLEGKKSEVRGENQQKETETSLLTFVGENVTSRLRSVQVDGLLSSDGNCLSSLETLHLRYATQTSAYIIEGP